MRHRLFSLIALMLIASVLLAACGGAAEPTAAPAAVEPTAAPEAVAEPTAAPAPAASGSMTKLGLWTHSAGNEGEMEVITKMADDFNASQDQFEVVIEAF